MLPRNYFYTAEPDMINVTKEEFEKFIEDYPRELERDVCGISDPPNITYNDFELANRWPYSVIARTFLYSDNKEDYWYCPEGERTYAVMKNFEEVFASKTGNQAKSGE